MSRSHFAKARPQPQPLTCLNAADGMIALS